MKKLLVFLAVICLLLTSTVMGIGTVASAAEESPIEDFMIFDGVLEEYIGPGGDVVIPASAGIVEIAAQAFYENADVTSVVIPEGVTIIGYGAFQKASNLEKVQLPYSLEEIGRSCFSDTILSEITIPGKLEIIPLWSFGVKESLRSITISYGVKEIHTQAFFKAKAQGGMKKVVFPETVELICGGAFGGQMDKEPVEYVICNPNCEVGYWDAHWSGENNMNHNWQPTLWSPFYSSVTELNTKVIVPEGSEVSKFLKDNLDKLFASDTYTGSLNIIEKSRTYFEDLKENQPSYGIQSPVTGNGTEQGGNDPTGGDNDPTQGDSNPTQGGNNPSQNANGQTQNNQQGSNQQTNGNNTANSSSSLVTVIIIVAGVILFVIIVFAGIIFLLFATGKIGGKKKAEAVKVEKAVEESPSEESTETSKAAE